MKYEYFRNSTGEGETYVHGKWEIIEAKTEKEAYCIVKEKHGEDGYDYLSRYYEGKEENRVLIRQNNDRLIDISFVNDTAKELLALDMPETSQKEVVDILLKLVRNRDAIIETPKSEKFL